MYNPLRMVDTAGSRNYRRRLKQHELVMSICSLFSEEYENSYSDSIWDVCIPIERIKAYLQEKHRTAYKSSLWLYTQLKRYEDELGVKLFRKEQSSDGEGFSLRIYHPFVNFHQKQHLHIGAKIKVANGVYEKIRHFAEERRSDEPIRLLLGAGSTIYHLAAIIAARSSNEPLRYAVYTHNLGALQQLMSPRVNAANIQVYTPQGRIDPTTYTIVAERSSLFQSSEFDFIVQGTSCVHEGRLYIESQEEWERKRTILAECSGQKILVLTKHEFSDVPFAGKKPYGTIDDYDWVVVPKRSAELRLQKRYEAIFDTYARHLVPEIISWNYEILRVPKDRRPPAASSTAGRAATGA